MCDVKRWDGQPMVHTHCTAKKFSGKKCNMIASTNPCGLCVLQGRASDDDDTEVAIADEEVEF